MQDEPDLFGSICIGANTQDNAGSFITLIDRLKFSPWSKRPGKVPWLEINSREHTRNQVNGNYVSKLVGCVFPHVRSELNSNWLQEELACRFLAHARQNS